jgi:hypothetical protein
MAGLFAGFGQAKRGIRNDTGCGLTVREWIKAGVIPGFFTAENPAGLIASQLCPLKP